MDGWRDFGKSATPGIKREWHDDGEGGGVIRTSQDVAPIIDRNRAMANHNDGYSPSRELRRAGTVPMLILYQWIAEAGLSDADPDYQDKLGKLILSKLDDPDFSGFRTAPGRLT